MREADFETLCRDHWPAILSYALRRTPGAADAGDVVAEVFAVAWRRRDEVPAGAAARPWLFGVARLVVANQRRGRVRRSRLQGRLAEVGQVLAPDPADVVAVGEQQRELLAALGQLAEQDRELLTLVAWDGLTPTEAAAAVGVSPATGRVRLHRARQRLRKKIEDSPQRQAGPGQVEVDGQAPVPVREPS